MKKRKAVLLAKVLVTSLSVSMLMSAASVSAEENIVLKLATWQASDLEAQAIQKAVDGFEETHPNIKVEYTVNSNADHHTKLLTQINSGEAPDVFWVSAEQSRDFISNGALLDLTDVIEESGMDFSDLLPSSVEKISYVDENGETHIYGLDACIVSPLIFYNKDLFDEAGVEYIPTKVEDQWTWDEFVENMQKLTKEENGEIVQYGICNLDDGIAADVTGELLLSNGAVWFNEDYTEAVGIDSEATRDTLEKIKSLRTEYNVMPNPTAAGIQAGGSATQLFMTGKVASVYIGSYALQELAQSGINLGVGLPPKMAEGINPTGSATLNCVWADTQYPTEAFELVQYLTDPEVCADIYSSGLWMPNRLSLYEEENIDLWYNDEIYPDNWMDMSWIFTDAVLRPIDHLHNTKEITDTCSIYLDDFLYNDASLDDLLPEMQEEVNALLAE